MSRWLPRGWFGQLRYFSAGLRRDPKHPADWRAWLSVGDFNLTVGTAVPTMHDEPRNGWPAGKVTRLWSNYAAHERTNPDD